MTRILTTLMLLSAVAVAAKPLSIVAFGDSTTAPRKTVASVYAERLPALLAQAGIEATVINSGVSGSHTGRLVDNARHHREHALDRFQKAVRAHRPDIVVVQFGINDSWVDSELPEDGSRIELADYRKNLTQIVSTLKADGARVIVMTPNKIGSKYPGWRLSRLAAYAEAARGVAQAQAVDLVDIWAADSAGAHDALLVDGMHPNDAGHERVARLLAERISGKPLSHQRAGSSDPMHAVTLDLIDLDGRANHHVVVDREAGQYLGHPTTCLLEDGKTILCVYPKGHGRGGIVYKRSNDGGRTWSDRLPTPQSWASSREVPTLHRVIDAEGTKRIIMWSGLYPARLSVSEDDGQSWSELEPVGDWGGIVVMGFVEALQTKGHYLAMFHDDGRFFNKDGKRTGVFTLYKTFSADGGLTWSFPEAVYASSELHLCEPGCMRSPDGKQLAVLLRENARRMNSHIIFSDDEGKTWTAPRELPLALTGDRHTGKYSKDGRMFISFRCRSPKAKAAKRPFEGDWIGWVGTWDDLASGREGQYQLRLKDNTHGYDTTYPGVEILPDDSFVVTTYGHWDRGESPYIRTAHFSLAELDRYATESAQAATAGPRSDLFVDGQFGVVDFRIPALCTAANGDLLAICDARIERPGDPPNHADLIMRRSGDSGKTWSEPRIIVDYGGKKAAGDASLTVDPKSGRIWVANVFGHEGVGLARGKNMPGYGDDTFHLHLRYSDDHGDTWSEFIDITEQVKPADWFAVWTAPGRGIVTSAGTIMIPFSGRAPKGDGMIACSNLAISDDGGKTWHGATKIGVGTNEAQVAELVDGTLMMNMRMNGTPKRFISTSSDGGKTWSKQVADPTLSGANGVQAPLYRYTAKAAGYAKNRLLFCSPDTPGKRSDLTVRMSYDEGKTWPVSKRIHAGPAAYSCFTILPDGDIGLLYENGKEQAAERLTFMRVSLEWLTDGADSLRKR